MPKIIWNNSFSVSVPEIDEQHQRWIKIINDLHDTLIGEDLDAVMAVTSASLAAMYEYAGYHFRHEEEFMREIGYPAYAGHREEHDRFMAKIEEYRRDLADGNRVLNSELMGQLMDWLESHILVEDKKYASFYQDRQVQVAR